MLSSIIIPKIGYKNDMGMFAVICIITCFCRIFEIYNN